MSPGSFLYAKRVELSVERWPWPFAEERRSDIAQFFSRQRRENPALWNGKLLLLRELSLAQDVLRGSLFETNYASLLAAAEWGALGEAVRASFGAAALLASDEAFIVGRMASYTRNAGQVSFPSGSFDPADVKGEEVDVGSSILRELEEETGLRPDEVDPQPGWCVVSAGPCVAVFKIVRAREPAARLRHRVLANLTTQTQPELADILVIRGREDVDSRMPAWMQIFLAQFRQPGTVHAKGPSRPVEPAIDR